MNSCPTRCSSVSRFSTLVARPAAGLVVGLVDGAGATVGEGAADEADGTEEEAGDGVNETDDGA